MTMRSDKRVPVEEFAARGIQGEPWVELGTAAELENWGEKEQIAYNQLRRQTTKRNFYIQAFDSLYANEIVGDYMEFGCHRARTFRMAVSEARRQNMHFMKFHAFDSFEGLPVIENEDEVSVSDYTPGALATSEEEFRRLVTSLGVYTDKIHTYKGFYQKSLTSQLQSELFERGVRASMICVDCDLYESAVPVFKFIEPFLQPGTLIYIDDYHVGYKGSPFAGVGKAFKELQERSEFTFAQFLPIGGFGMSFITCKV
ncbi:MAG: TylF/MycF/NovP-related O-methyltransferase [Bdellovibrionota bacterium]